MLTITIALGVLFLLAVFQVCVLYCALEDAEQRIDSLLGRPRVYEHIEEWPT